MTISAACPIATINAPIERVWELLAEPANYDLWWEAQTRSIVPEGRAQAGQKILAKVGGLNMLAIVDGVDESKYQIHFTTKLPFGITGFNHITCTALPNSATQVSFGCDFAFSPVWWGWIWEHFGLKQIHASVADALSRLKHAAEGT